MATSSHSTAHPPPIMSAPVEDFTSFLDLGDFSVDFTSFEPIPEGHPQHGASELGPLVDGGAPGGGGGIEGLVGMDAAGVMAAQDPQRNVLQLRPHPTMPVMTTMQQQVVAEMPLALDLQAQLFRQQQQEQQQRFHQEAKRQQQQQQRAREQTVREQAVRRQWILPPTPNSGELPSGPYYHAAMDSQMQAQTIRYQRSHEEQVGRAMAEW